MPHLTLEYTDNLPDFNAADVLLELNRTLVASGHFRELDIKSRAIKLDNFVVGTSTDRRAFAHVKLAILSGRSPEAKLALSESLLRVLKGFDAATAEIHVQLCVEIQDIDRACYAKAAS
jgi:5-carboxymethyl-2-hydroxymuconate isomerase